MEDDGEGDLQVFIYKCHQFSVVMFIDNMEDVFNEIGKKIKFVFFIEIKVGLEKEL